MVTTTYRRARANLARLMDEETAHLLRSPANARRLLRALARAEGGSLAPTSIEELRREVGLDRDGE
jgi:antitoxin YefM